MSNNQYSRRQTWRQAERLSRAIGIEPEVLVRLGIETLLASTGAGLDPGGGLPERLDSAPDLPTMTDNFIDWIYRRRAAV